MNGNRQSQDGSLTAKLNFTGLSHTAFLAVVSFLVAVISLIVFILTKQKKFKRRGNSVALVGLPDSGKTSILSTLIYGHTLPTHSSLQTNTSVLSLPSGKSLKIVDIPGHPRVRDQFQEHLADCKAVVFVVDASTISRNGPAVAEHLHNIMSALSSIPPSQTAPNLLILAHKSDLLKTSTVLSATPQSLAITRVKGVLERELEKRRASQTGVIGIEGLGAEGEKSDLGGLECTYSGEFKFAGWEFGEISFIGTCVKSTNGVDERSATSDGLHGLTSWIDSLP